MNPDTDGMAQRGQRFLQAGLAMSAPGPVFVSQRSKPDHRGFRLSPE